ncbi:uncharacterized protein LOC143915651 [Arctopsyche grandis]|uniref:uncharacterized protein LOC143915651 n=1 Tax=Arctopsyche grandis TaxID=121162 RepID=UPI00406D82EE
MAKMNLALIEQIRSYPYLYDVTDKRYSDMQMKEVAWMKIGKKLNHPHSACKKTWTKLRDSYRRSVKKNKREIINGQVVRKRWKYDEEMEFLLPFIKERDTSSIVLPQLSDDEDDNQEDYIDLEDNAKLTEDFAEPPNKKYKESETLEGENVSTFLMKHILENRTHSSELDNIEAFFVGMASTVKMFSPLNKAIAKGKIFSIVSEMELENLGITKQTNATATLPYIELIKSECEDLPK